MIVSFIMDMTTLQNTVVGSIVGALATVLFGWIRNELQARRGEYTGEWTQIIPAWEGEPQKIAIVTCKHRGDRLYATTVRTEPPADYPQRWKVEARHKRGLVYGIYWPEDASKLPGSYGTLQFKVVNDNLFAGFYVRAHSAEGGDPGQSEFSEKLKSIPIRWERIVRKKK